MKLITRDVDYAVRALCFITQHPQEKVSVSELVNKLKVPRPFLRKILQILNTKGVLISHKGKGGGFSLAKASNRIFLSRLIEIFHGPLKLHECFLRKNICSDVRSCVLKHKVDIIERNIQRQLGVITIASLVNGRTKHG